MQGESQQNSLETLNGVPNLFSKIKQILTCTFDIISRYTKEKKDNKVYVKNEKHIL